MPHDAFIDPETGEPYNFSPELVTSGVSVGVPGTLATWERALDRWGTFASRRRSRRPRARRPAASASTRPSAARSQQNQRAVPRLRADHAPALGGHAPRVGCTFRNPDLADDLPAADAARHQAVLRGRSWPARSCARCASRRRRRTPTLPVPEGFLVAPRPRRATAPSTRRRRTIGYRGLDVYGMAPSSSGGSTVGEALNILESYDLAALPADEALHLYLEASALAFADRGEYVGDPARSTSRSPTCSRDEYAAERACQINPAQAAAEAGRGRRRHVVRRGVRAGRVATRAPRTRRTSRPRT